jgi:ribosomal protein S18 acetylase RimI-like enzyme
MATRAPASILEIRLLDAIDDARREALVDVLVDCVEGGASVNFMLPFTRDRARAFWRKVADGLARGDRVLLVAEDGGGIVGTVQVVFAEQDNQPHRADVAKMLVHRRGRRRGIGEALMQAAEAAARAHGKTTLVLDTASDDAARLYTRLGWQVVGTIPDYALMPDGQPCASTYFYKAIAA